MAGRLTSIYIGNERIGLYDGSCKDGPGRQAYVLRSNGNRPERVVFCDRFLEHLEEQQQLNMFIGKKIDPGVAQKAS